MVNFEKGLKTNPLIYHSNLFARNLSSDKDLPLNKSAGLPPHEQITDLDLICMTVDAIIIFLRKPKIQSVNQAKHCFSFSNFNYL